MAARDRAQLERLCRYGLRPPVAQDRLRLTRQRQVVLELRHQWTDGTTHLAFDPLELLERLAALTPRPRINLVLYYGVLGARSAWRARLVAPEPGRPLATAGASATSSAHRPRTNWLWAELMQRSFRFDVLACRCCGGRLELIALIEDPRVPRPERGGARSGRERLWERLCPPDEEPCASRTIGVRRACVGAQ